MSFVAASADAEDRRFLAAFVSGTLHPRDFRHREHLRLAYLCLIAETDSAAALTFRHLLRDFLNRQRIDPNKYHETLTCVWLQIVAHHLARTPDTVSFADFIARHPALADANLVFTHYTRERLVSPQACESFLAPDLKPLADDFR